MYFLDPLYIFVMAVCFLLSMSASLWVKAATSRWSKVPIGQGLAGKEIARIVLDAQGIDGVRIERVGGFLSDHYDPGTRTLRLSPGIHDGRSVTAAGVAAHEAGHAIQHAQGYAPMQLRQAMVPAAKLGTSLGIWLVVIGAAIGVSGLAKLGVVLFGCFVLFTFITLPVELDASFRAKKALLASGLISGEEARGVSEVLTAAAATYLASALSAVLQLLYWAMRAGLLRGRRE